MNKTYTNIGKVFGNYKIIDNAPSHRSPNGTLRKMYLCECQICGNIKIMNAYKVTHNFYKNCPNCKKYSYEDLTGKKFGKLTVIKESEISVDNPGIKKRWVCQCDCGTTNVIVFGDHLKNGHTKSCGCYQKEALLNITSSNFINKNFGKLTVLSFAFSKKGVNYWNCKCQCGKNCIVSSRYLQNDKLIHSCGCETSKSESELAQFLDIHQIQYVRQYTFDDCKIKRKLPFDFAIFKDNIFLFLIELQGEYHYKLSHFKQLYYDEELRIKKFNSVQKSDKIKFEYCQAKNIPILYIDYTEFDNKEKIFMNYYNSFIKKKKWKSPLKNHSRKEED